MVAQRAAEVAKHDTELEFDSLYGFTAMFKKKESSPPIATILSQIHNYESLNGFNHNPRRWIPPTFVCVAQDIAAHYAHLNLPYNPWWRCLWPPRDGRPNHAFYIELTPLIFICPNFFKQPLAPLPSRGNSGCPSIVYNQFVGDVNAFYRDYQSFTLLYQLIHFYLGTKGLNSATVPRETFDWNVCVSYSAEASIINPTNILLYIASESLPNNYTVGVADPPSLFQW